MLTNSLSSTFQLSLNHRSLSTVVSLCGLVTNLSPAGSVLVEFEEKQDLRFTTVLVGLVESDVGKDGMDYTLSHLHLQYLSRMFKHSKY